jgi:tripartite-type tricarboxylate transporter receptor subunit TctC
MVKTRSSVAAVLLGAVMLVAGAAGAQSEAAYPSKAVKFVVTLAPGGLNDILGRLFAGRLASQLGRPFVVENRPGAISGADYVAKSAGDGYTLLLANTSILAIQPHLFAKLPYDPLADFVPISLIAISPSVLVVNAGVPVKTFKELVDLAKADPTRLSYATPGNGTPFHLWTELVKKQAGIEMAHVPYKGAQPAFLDLVAGRVQVMFINLDGALPHLHSGKLRSIAQNGAKRHALMPEVPTLAEHGLANIDSYSFFALVAPSGTPKDVLATLHAQVGQAQKHRDVQDKFKQFTLASLDLSLQEVATYVRNENAKWARVIKDSGAKVDN